MQQSNLLPTVAIAVSDQHIRHDASLQSAVTGMEKVAASQAPRQNTLGPSQKSGRLRNSPTAKMVAAYDVRDTLHLEFSLPNFWPTPASEGT